MQTEYRRRRASIAARIGESAAMLLFTANEKIRSRDTAYPYRADSDFFYVCGFPEPDAVFLFLPGHDKHDVVLFTRPRDPEREIWDGHRFGPEGAERDFGADAAFSIDRFDELLPGMLQGRDQLYYELGPDAERDRGIVGTVRRLAASRDPAQRGPSTISDPRTILHPMRRVKSAAELDAMERAAEVSAIAQHLAMERAHPGMMEYEVQAIIEHEMRRLGATGPAYQSIVAGGANACILHYIENRAVLVEGDLVLIDAGAEVNGYAGDITRTWPVGATFTAAQRALYDGVLDVQKRAIARCTVGTDWGAHHMETRRGLCEVMIRCGLLEGDVDELVAHGADRRFFMHGTGHYLGLDVHDVGDFAVRTEDGTAPLPLEPGVVVTVEPGIYVAPDAEDVPDALRGVGIRIEDDVIVQVDGPKVITSMVPKDASEIEKLRSKALSSA